MKRQEPGLAVVVLKEKRIRLLDSEGKEEEVAPEEDAAWKRLAATGEQPKAEKDEDEMEEEKEAEGNEEKVLNPLEAIENLTAAKGELELVLDLVVKLEQQQEVSIPNVPDTRTHAGRLGSMAREAALRSGRCRQALKKSATTLREGLEALQERSKRDNNFYAELASLQGFWKVQHNPAVGSQSAFSLDLSLGRVAENANRPPAVPCKIDIYQDEHGKLKIYVPREEQLHEPEVSVQQSQQDNPRGTGIVSRNEDQIPTPTLSGNSSINNDHSFFQKNQTIAVIGGKAVHSYLLQKHKNIVWSLLRATLRCQGALCHTGGHYNVIVQKLLTQVEGSSDPRTAAFKPYLLMRFLGHIFKTPMVPKTQNQFNADGMLTELISWASHSLHSRQVVWQSMEHQAITCNGLMLHWQATWHPYLSALHINIPEKFGGILVIRGSTIELEGTMISDSESSRYLSVCATQGDVHKLAKALVHGEDTSFLGNNFMPTGIGCEEILDGDT